jgi:hypothetical protein
MRSNVAPNATVQELRIMLALRPTLGMDDRRTRTACS